MTETLRRPQSDDTSPALVSASGPARTLPAGRVLVVMVVALSLASLFNSRRFVHAAEGLPYGWQRSALLSVAHPVDDAAHWLRTDRPRARLDRALGRDVTRTSGGAFSQPSAAPSAQPSSVPSASATVPPATTLRAVSPAAPLKLFITGDSMIEFMGPKVIKLGEPARTVDGASEVKYGTGLVRDDFFDWPAHARSQMASRNPEAVVVMMGGNDGQNIQLPGGRILQGGTPEWTAEYQRRATIMMQILTGGGARHVYWVGMPIARSARLAKDYAALDTALRGAAAAVPGARYVDIWADFAPGGRYSDYVGGTLVRARDGIHLNRDGAARLARKVYALLDADWRLAPS